MGDHSSVEVDAVVKNTEKEKRGLHVQYMPLGQKRKKMTICQFSPLSRFSNCGNWLALLVPGSGDWSDLTGLSYSPIPEELSVKQTYRQVNYMCFIYYFSEHFMFCEFLNILWTYFCCIGILFLNILWKYFCYEGVLLLIKLWKIFLLFWYSSFIFLENIVDI